jgi:class 3 adenylate cyclase
MGRDESGTLACLRKNRSEYLNPILAKYGGRLVKLTGDGALIEFASAVDALSAAIEFQQAMSVANSDQPADHALVTSSECNRPVLFPNWQPHRPILH